VVVAAIAAEYNPFHNGHAFHIAETRAAGATHIAAVMSGNFTQRGTPAIAEKHVRAKAALQSGVDLVVELPLPYAMATAQRFAYGAVGVACGMGCVDMMSFGSESGYLSLISAAAQAVDSPVVCERMSYYLEQGMTFAKARQLAVSELCGDEVADRLGTPNDALAVEYVRNLALAGSDISPFAVLRHGAGHDSAEPCKEIASASYLRGLIRSGGVQAVMNLMPQKCFETLREGADEGHLPFDERRMEPIVFGALRKLSAEAISLLPDISEGLENRVFAAIRQAASLQEVYTLSKSKRYTSARIRRVVMAAFLNLNGSLCMQPVPYIHILGFNAKGREILSKIRTTASIPVSDSMAYLRRQGQSAADFVDAETLSTDLYRLGLPKTLPCGYDFTVDSVRI
jgi:predicted nucleotidyltransferase